MPRLLQICALLLSVLLLPSLPQELLSERDDSRESAAQPALRGVDAGVPEDGSSERVSADDALDESSLAGPVLMGAWPPNFGSQPWAGGLRRGRSDPNAPFKPPCGAG